MSFRNYVVGRRITDTPAGDFTKDARSDPNLPDAKTWAELKAYLENIPGRAEGVMEAGRTVWLGYQQRKRNQGA